MRILLSLLVAMLVFGIFVIAAYADDNASSYAILTKKVNFVKVLTTTSKQWEDAELNQKYRPGDMIRTGSGSVAQLELSDGSVIKLSPYTQIMIDPVAREVHLDIGQVFVKFFKGAKNPKVKTPTSVAAALGTMWVQELNSVGTTEIHVLEHQVDLNSGGASQVVNEGQFTTAVSGQPPLQPQAFDISQYIKSEKIFDGLDVKKLMGETPPPPSAKTPLDMNSSPTSATEAIKPDMVSAPKSSPISAVKPPISGGMSVPLPVPPVAAVPGVPVPVVPFLGNKNNTATTISTPTAPVLLPTASESLMSASASSLVASSSDIPITASSAQPPIIPPAASAAPVASIEKEKNKEEPSSGEVGDIKSGIKPAGYGWIFTAAGDGLMGIDANPASLAKNNFVDVMIPQMGLFVSNNAVTGTQLMNFLMNSGNLQAKADIENSVAAAGSLSGKVQTQLATGFSVGNFALSIHHPGLWDITGITPDAAAIMVGDVQKLNLTPGVPKTWNIGGKIAIVQPATIGLTYAQPFTLFDIPVSIGATTKFYTGGSYSNNDFIVQGSYTGSVIPPTFTQNSLIKDDATGASGMGIDLGARAKLADNFYTGLAITDLGGDIAWSGIHGTGSASADPIIGTFTTNYIYNSATFYTQQNTTLRAGVAYVADIAGPTMFALDYVSSRLTSSGIDGGIEKNIGPVNIRLGFIHDIYKSSSLMNYGIGFKMGVVNVDIIAAGSGLGGKEGMLSLNISAAF